MNKNRKWFGVLVFVGVGIFGGSANALQRDLERIIPRIEEVRSHGKTPVAVFDLDETLIDSMPRVYQSLLEAATEMGGKYPEELNLFKRLRLADFFRFQNRYDLVSILKKMGIQDPAYLDALLKRELEIYLSPRWMDFDRSMPCGTEIVRYLLKNKAVVFFISSRLHKSVGDATLRSLSRLGFMRPGEAVHLLLRPEGMPSLEFKKKSFERVKQFSEANDGEVMLVSENEPENMNAMMMIFPEALPYFVTGAYLKKEPLHPAPFTVLHFCK